MIFLNSFSVTNLPEKGTIYATLVGLLNEKNFDFGGEVWTLHPLAM